MEWRTRDRMSREVGRIAIVDALWRSTPRELRLEAPGEVSDIEKAGYYRRLRAAKCADPKPAFRGRNIRTRREKTASARQSSTTLEAPPM